MKKEIEKYFNRRRCKGMYSINELSNRIQISVLGKLKDKINNEDIEFYHEFSDWMEEQGYEVDMYDTSTINCYEM